MKLDFLIYYEHASRELESDCYLASILSRRGYKVKVINRHHPWRIFYSPRIIVVPFLYSEEDVHEFTGYISGEKRAIVNLQYEQMLNEVGLKANFYHPSGSAKWAYHLCWGENTKERLLDDGVDYRRLPVVGSIGMDFNRPELRTLLKDKEQLAREFGLDREKKWHLFISSFSLCSLSTSDLEIIENKLPGYKEFVEVAKASQSAVLSWIKEMAEKFTDIDFIYRPHPNEHVSDNVIKFFKCTKNIHIIGNYSIRQWINVCETSSSWFSTSTVDCYFSQRPCCVLRPIPIPDKFDQKIFIGCDFFTKCEEYELFLKGNIPQKSPLKTEQLSKFYLTDMTKLYGELTADACEVAYNDEYKPYSRYWKDCLRSLIYDMLAGLFRLFPFLGSREGGRYYGFHMMALETKRDKLTQREYIKRFKEFWRYGK